LDSTAVEEAFAAATDSPELVAFAVEP